MREQPVVIEVENQQLVGMLHLPERSELTPGVLFLHGFTGNKSEGRRLFVRQARRLAQVGIASLRIDFRGSGDSAGDSAELTVSSERADALAALDYLARRPEIDSKRLAVLGMSLGGMIAAFTLGARRELKTGVLWNPVAFPKQVRDRRMTPESEAELRERGVIDDGGWAIGAEFMEEMGNADPLRAISGVKAPILVIGSTADEIVPHSHAEAYHATAREQNVESRLHRIIGAGHTFASLPWAEEVLSTTESWLHPLLSVR